ncbi:IBR domain, a half RING-finger domain-containing protein [Ditylenchus destructor]|uniref:RBR-type E3 ubiquitin transferase n=1 Tax=Ditylenchus destructor TaxID=166010 RepID=A0AAD4N0B6_9BILA|nr:IBR domain, a half RING-finger domain-containing protein [Ditylenchus destructor]
MAGSVLNVPIRVVPSHRSSSFESSGKEGAHTTSQSMSEGRTKEEERDAYDPARAPTQLADTHASLSSSFVRPSLIDWLVVCAPSFPLDSKLELREMNACGDANKAGTSKFEDTDANDDFNYETEDDDCEENNFLSLPTTSKANDNATQSTLYEIISQDEITTQLNEELRRVAEIVDYSQSICRAMLQHFNWDSDKLLYSFADNGNMDKFFNSTKLLDPKQFVPAQPTDGDCGICFVPCSVVSLNCYDHYYCPDCWAGYIKSKLSERIVEISCVDTDCDIVANGDFILKIIGDDADMLKDYNKLLLNNYILTNPRLRWCPGAKCDSKVIKITNRASCISIKCNCGWEFCFKCGNEPHEPIVCHLLKVWLDECKQSFGEEESLRWMTTNSKPCPKCESPIEKNGGCNHMTCRNCNHEFCWLCMKNWHGHNTGTCNQFAQEAMTEKASKESKLQAQYHRYKHYYERYVSYEKSVQTGKELYGKFEEKSDNVLNQGETTTCLAYLKKAMDTLIASRRTLMYTYTFAFYMTDTNHAKIFMDNQEHLANYTETLGQYLEHDLTRCESLELKLEVINMSEHVSKHRERLLKHCHEGTEKGDWDFQNADKKRVVGY